MLGKLFVFALACIVCVRRASPTPSFQDINELSKRLLVNYSKHSLPSNTNGFFNRFDIDIQFGLVSIGGIDETEQTLSTILWVNYTWKDERISWDLKDTNVNDITLGWSDVWKPVFRLKNPQTGSSQAQYSDRSFETVKFKNSGWANFDEYVTTRTACDMDMTYYPFDAQTCYIEMELFEQYKFWFDLSVSELKAFDPKDTEHGSWVIIDNASYDVYGYFVITLVFGRRPLFLLLNVVLPLYILALLTPVVFLLPKKSGERVGYCVAMLLAISVYMTIVSDHLTQNSHPAPLLTIFIFAGYVFDAVVVLVVIVNTKINLTKPEKPVPSACSAFVKLTKKMVCPSCSKLTEKYFKKQNCNKVGTVGNDEDGSEGMHNAAFDEENGKDVNVIDEENRKDVNVTWQELSHAIDKWCFVISFLVKFFMPVLVFIVMRVKSQA